MNTGHRLPAFRTSFVGRSEELNTLGLLLAKHRLVTLTGTGGAGKTRLAVEAAARVEGPPRGGIVFCDLSRVAGGRQVAHAITQALDVPESAAPTLDSAIEVSLSVRPTLLILDNCEHVLPDVARLVAKILDACPEARILATSRARLGVGGEAVLPIPPLALPPAGIYARDDWRSVDSLQLFADRLEAHAGPREWTEPRVRAAARIVRAVDAIPLAIELAAARGATMGLDDLECRLRAGLDLKQPHASSPRHETLNAAIRWSYDLLDEPARKLFRRLSVFGGGGVLADIEAVCSGDGLEAHAIADEIAGLVGQSLVTVEETHGPSRYRLLEPLREFADGELDAAGESSEFGRRHCERFLASAARAAGDLRGPRQPAALAALDAETANLRAAVDRALAGGEYELAADLICALELYWRIRGRFREAASRAEAALAGAIAERSRGRLLVVSGNAASSLGDHVRAIGLLSDAVAALREHGSDAELGEALCWLGLAYERQRDPSNARRAVAEAGELLRPGDTWLSSLRLRVLAHSEKVATGDMACVRELHQREFELCQVTGDYLFTANVMNCLAEFERWDGHFERAGSLYEQSLTRRRAIGDQSGIAVSLVNTALLAIQTGRFEEARERLTEALGIVLHLGTTIVHGSLFVAGAGVAFKAGRPELSGRLLGSALAFEVRGREGMDPPDGAVFDAVASWCSTAMGEDQFASAVQSGRLLDATGAVAALQECLVDAVGAAPRLPTAGSLSERETQVLSLLATGLTNKEIAQRLVLGRRTVETHVANVYNKLGVNNRAEAATTAFRLGLVPASGIAP